jgi:hypothetical protein
MTEREIRNERKAHAITQRQFRSLIQAQKHQPTRYDIAGNIADGTMWRDDHKMRTLNGWTGRIYTRGNSGAVSQGHRPQQKNQHSNCKG